jgi:diacylglycerol kinase (ATP)
MARSVVLVNPHASRLRDAPRRERAVAAAVTALATRDGIPPEVVVPASAAEAMDAVRAAVASGATTIVGMGGDGTLKEIATVIAGTDTELGIVPGGTGNVLAGVLGIPASLEAAAGLLATARPRTIDLGEVDVALMPEPAEGHPPPGPTATARPADGGAREAQPGAAPDPDATHSDRLVHRRLAFAIGCGIGFDARVMATTPPDLKRRLGRMAYFAQAAWLAARIGAVPYRIAVDGRSFEIEASIALVANLGELIPGIVAPRLPVVPDDGLLDVFVVGARGPVQGMRGLIDQLRRSEPGEGRRATTLRIRGSHVTLSSEPAEPLQVDGDHLGIGSLEATIRPRALRVLAPG